MGIVERYRAWSERRLTRPRCVEKWQVTAEEWNEGVRHPELMLGAVAGVSGPVCSAERLRRCHGRATRVIAQTGRSTRLRRRNSLPSGATYFFFEAPRSEGVYSPGPTYRTFFFRTIRTWALSFRRTT